MTKALAAAGMPGLMMFLGWIMLELVILVDADR